jgi:hypothetical protein
MFNFLSEFATLSLYLFLSHLVQEMKERNRNVIISTDIIFSVELYGAGYKLQAPPSWRSLLYETAYIHIQNDMLRKQALLLCNRDHGLQSQSANRIPHLRIFVCVDIVPLR